MVQPAAVALHQGAALIGHQVLAEAEGALKNQEAEVEVRAQMGLSEQAPYPLEQVESVARRHSKVGYRTLSKRQPEHRLSSLSSVKRSLRLVLLPRDQQVSGLVRVQQPLARLPAQGLEPAMVLVLVDLTVLV